jgi:probable HAF family extracellular repeat protein
MKCTNRNMLTTLTTALMLFAPVGMVGQGQTNSPSTDSDRGPQVAQDNSPRQHSHYRVMDVGTFGGPTSGYNFGAVIINARGAVVGVADTSIFDPNCGCFVTHAFRWENGVTTDLGALPGGESSFAGGINSRGTIIGLANVFDPMTGLLRGDAALWKRGQISDLGTLGGPFAAPNAINNREQIVGGGLNTIPDPFGALGPFLGGTTQTRALLWQNGAMIDIGTLGGNDAFAISVNERGQIVGNSFTNTIPNPETGMPTVDPFFRENGHMFDVGGLGGKISTASWMNNRGQIAGTSDLAGDQTVHPFFWQKGSHPRDLGTLGGDNGSALWINDAGHVAGRADLADAGIHHAFLWKNGVMQDLKPAGSGLCSNAFAINSSDQVVGNTTDCQGTGLGATFWDHDQIVDLNSFVAPGSGIFLRECVFINDQGEIAVVGSLNGNDHAFVLVPDGHCDGDCDSRIGASQNDAASQDEATRNPGMPINSVASSNAIERLHNRSTQRYQLPRQRSVPSE